MTIKTIDILTTLFISPCIIGFVVWIGSYFINYQPFFPVFEAWPGNRQSVFLFENILICSSVINIGLWIKFLYNQRAQVRNYFSNKPTYKISRVFWAYLLILGLYVLLVIVIMLPIQTWDTSSDLFNKINFIPTSMIISIACTWVVTMHFIAFTIVFGFLVERMFRKKI